MKKSQFIKEGLEDGHEQEALEAYIEVVGEEYAELSGFEDAYNGEWDSDEDFVQNLIEEIGGIPESLPGYIHIDWEGTARDVMMDYSEENGHYFRDL